jgi:hypothetical protein
MEGLLVSEPRRALAPLQVNDAVPYDVATRSSKDRSPTQAKQRWHTESNRSPSPSSKTQRRATRVSPHPFAGADRNETATARAYPPLRNVLPTTAVAPITTTTPKTSFQFDSRVEASGAAPLQAVQTDGIAEKCAGGGGTTLTAAATVAPSGSDMGDVSHVASVHPPSSAKPQIPSRRTSMARLRQRQQQLKSVVEEEEGERIDAVTAATSPPAPVPTADGDAPQTGANPHASVQIYSYRPTLTSLTSISASSDDLMRSTPEKVKASESTHEASRAHESGKMLPNELCSPRGGTEVCAASDDSRTASHDTDDTPHRLVERFASQRHPASQPLRPPALQLRGEVAASLPASEQPGSPTDAVAVAAAVVTEEEEGASAPFHALQLVPPCSHDPFMSPPHSGRSDCGGGGGSGRAPVVAGGGSATAKQAHVPDAIEQDSKQPPPWYQTAALADGADVLIDDGDGDGDNLLVCPFALLGCCASGTHTAAEMQMNATLHHHLVAVAGSLRRMKARQQQLEQNVVLLRSQLDTQTRTLRETTAQLEWLKKKRPTVTRTGPLLQRGATQTEADVSRSLDTPVSSEGDAQSAPTPQHGSCTHKALPADMSLHEPQVTDYGVEEDGEDGQEEEEEAGSVDHDPAGEYGTADEGAYARQLRQRTQSAKYLYTLRGSPEETGRRDAERENQQPSTAITAATACGSSGPRAASAQPRTGTRNTSASQRGPQSKRSATGERAGVTSKDGVVETNSNDVAPTKRNSIVGPPTSSSSYPYEVQRGACGSTEVSGMSNVPPYQLPNESVSTISNASSDLNDHEDDTVVGVMQQQLLCLSAEDAAAAAAVAQTTSEGKEPTRAVRSRRSSLKECRTNQDVHCEGSTPSLVSTTYRPSQLAHARNIPEAVVAITPLHSSLSADHAVGQKDAPSAAVGHPVQQDTQASTDPTAFTAVSADGVRRAMALQRPTLIRKTDVSQDRTHELHSKTPVILPRATTLTTTRTAASALLCPTPSAASSRGTTATSTPTVGIMNKTASLQSRRLSVRDSEGARITAVDFNGTEGGDGNLVGEADRSSRGGTKSATPAVSSAVSLLQTPLTLDTRRATAHACSYHVEGSHNDDQPEHYTIIVEPRKRSISGSEERDDGASRRSSLSRSRRASAATTSRAASRRPQHATSLLSSKEVGERGEVVHLGLPHRREVE